MPLSWNEIRTRAVHFSIEWKDEISEKAEAKSFWDGFFNVFGVNRRKLASYEHNVKKLSNKNGFIDLFWRGKLLVEHKSRGSNLDSAYGQALDYFEGLSQAEIPRYIIVSDFARIRLYDLDKNTQREFLLEDFHKHISLFGFIAGYQALKIEEQDPVNVEAAERMGKLHDQMKEVGYEGHILEVYLVRLLFCMFAEDTGIFELQQFQLYIEDRTHDDGSDLASYLSTFFQVLNTPNEKRLKNIDDQLASFPYINGKLFEEVLPTAGFDSAMRKLLLSCCALDWSSISPAIFGSLFQSIMDKNIRRNLGAHYTSEKNILKLINPLFMDELKEEFSKVKNNKKKLVEFHLKLRSLTFLDPACGCGNFLIIAYRELRLLELEIIRAANRDGQMILDISEMIWLDVDQFYGIEIEEFPVQIAQVALWLIDHQMNLLVSEEFGMYFMRIPLKSNSNIVCGNALSMDWSEIIAANKLSYIIGNPPFVGAKYMNEQQRLDIKLALSGVKNAGLLDFVSAWYVKSAQFCKINPNIQSAFVSTNSITHGEQVGILWGYLLAMDIQINFAHRTFSWNNEASRSAAVHCVIIGFSLVYKKNKRLFEYEDIKKDPQEFKANNINPYLVDAPNEIIVRRSKPLCNVPEIGIGNKPIDGGNYLFTGEEKIEFLKAEPQAEKYFQRWLGAHEFLNGYERWCLRLAECPPNELRSMPESLKRIEAVKQFRLSSKSKPTQKLAETPRRFHVENIPSNTYIIIPEVSSGRRRFIPIGFETPQTLCSNLVKIIPNANLFHFGILLSTMHNSWVRSTCGRLKSDYRYSKDIVYNNFPWPLNPSEKQILSIEEKAKAVLNARNQFPNTTLAELYDPLIMPFELYRAHQALDKVVDHSYSDQKFKLEAERIAFLFELYRKYIE